jgi:FtsP/CotA-like multicopper oxidase with cupredoxin domain
MIGRRTFLKSAAAAGGMALLSPHLAFAQRSAALLRVSTRTIEVNNKPAKVFHVAGQGGRAGILAREGDRLEGVLLNDTAESLQMHWHGQVLAPHDQDRARPGGGTLAAGQSDMHDFELTPGTHWLHSHTLSEQQLLAAPMVTLEKNSVDVQNIVIMLHDFAFRSPQEILAELGGSDAHAGHGAMSSPPRASHASVKGHMGHGAMHHGAGHGKGHGHGAGRDHMMGMTHANDVRYDAYLANDRTLDDPEVVKVEKGGRVRLRIINGGTATAFFITIPGLKTSVVAVDGLDCRPFSVTAYPLAQGQRIDLIAQIPKEGGAFPVLAQIEDAWSITGIILATVGAKIAKQNATAPQRAAMVDLSLDRQLAASKPLAAKRPDQTFMVMLGEQPNYRWTINGRIHGEHEAFRVRQGERVEMTFMNPTSMMHPMHLHGHRFQVVGVGGRRYSGPMRDTVIVPAHMPVTIAFDALQKGAWYLHCHHLYHMATGMMTEVVVA